MALHVNVQGYDEFKKAAEEHADKTIFALFTGSAGSDGRSWCPDCVTADPIIERNLKHIPADCVFIRCGVGDRAFWKDQNNVFRKDPKLRLTSVPTLLKYGQPQQLKEEQCAKDDLVQMLFTED